MGPPRMMHMVPVNLPVRPELCQWPGSALTALTAYHTGLWLFLMSLCVFVLVFMAKETLKLT